jgi:SAM-dependent methyltransferase
MQGRDLSKQEQLIQLTDWYQTDIGRSLYQFESAQLKSLLPICYGYQLLQIGGPASLAWLDASPIQHKLWLAPQPTQIASFYATPDFLPFPPNTFDVIILPHTLECCEHPEIVLHEAYNALIPGGYLIILGISNLSLWGIHHRWQKLCHQKMTLPWLSQFQHISRLQMQLRHMHCVIDSIQTGYFLPLTDNAEQLRNWRLLDIVGSFAWPAFGASYTILARKLVENLILLPNERSRLELDSAKISLAQQRSTLNE